MDEQCRQRSGEFVIVPLCRLIRILRLSQIELYYAHCFIRRLVHGRSWWCLRHDHRPRAVRTFGHQRLAPSVHLTIDRR